MNLRFLCDLSKSSGGDTFCVEECFVTLLHQAWRHDGYIYTRKLKGFTLKTRQLICDPLHPFISLLMLKPTHLFALWESALCQVMPNGWFLTDLIPKGQLDSFWKGRRQRPVNVRLVIQQSHSYRVEAVLCYSVLWMYPDETRQWHLTAAVAARSERSEFWSRSNLFYKDLS